MKQKDALQIIFDDLMNGKRYKTDLNGHWVTVLYGGELDGKKRIGFDHGFYMEHGNMSATLGNLKTIIKEEFCTTPRDFLMLYHCA